MALTKKGYIDALYNHLCEECGKNSPFEEAISGKEEEFLKKWLPAPDRSPHDLDKYNEAWEDLVDLLYIGVKTGFAVGFNVANEINRPVIYKND